MAAVAYTSNVRIERIKGPLRRAYLPGESQPVMFSVHGGIAKHYGIDESQLPEPHAATIDYVVAATAG